MNTRDQIFLYERYFKTHYPKWNTGLYSGSDSRAEEGVFLYTGDFKSNLNADIEIFKNKIKNKWVFNVRVDTNQTFEFSSLEEAVLYYEMII